MLNACGTHGENIPTTPKERLRSDIYKQSRSKSKHLNCLITQSPTLILTKAKVMHSKICDLYKSHSSRRRVGVVSWPSPRGCDVARETSVVFPKTSIRHHRQRKVSSIEDVSAKRPRSAASVYQRRNNNIRQ